MTDSTLNPLNFLLPNGPDNRFLFRLVESVGVVSAALIPAFIVYTQLAGRFPSEVQYGTVLYLALVAVFCLRPALKDADGHRTMLDLALNLVLIVGASFAFAYFTDQYDDIADMREGLPNQWDLACYLVGSVVVVFGAHRAEGWLLTAVVLLATIYLVFGHVMPGILEHRPFSMNRVLEISYGYRGIFGVALGAVVDIVLVFVILGVTLRLTGAGEFFNDLALILTRGKRSGPAQCAIIASAMFGSINGSAPANVASTGILTIPMMRRAGYSGRFAGGVEATASCVGQIMPPIMGVGAFIMSDVTGIPYITIMFAAIIPAMLYLFSLSITVSLEASRLSLDPLADETPKWDRKMISRASLLIIGFGSLLTMLFSGFPATFSGLVASGIILVLATILPDTRLSYQNWFTLAVDSGRDGLSVLLSCAAIGIVIAAITSTGLGIKLNQEITALGDQNLLAALLLAALCSIVLGMGLPTAASYLMVIFVAGPAIMELGVSKLSTHLFVFYYAVLSAITPPVALAIFAAAAIAKENPIALALNALRLASVGFVLPIAWVYHPEIIIGADGLGILDALTYVPILLIGITALSAAHVGHLFRRLTIPERLVLAVGAVAILMPSTVINLAATLIVLLVSANAYRGSHNVKTA